MKLNLGCGEKKRAGYINVDICGCPDVKCDLSKFPWPFADESADEVFSEHWLEHVVDYERTILEIHRILKPNGTIHAVVPYFKSPYFPWCLHIITCLRLGKAYPYLFNGRQLFSDVNIRLGFYWPKWLKAIFSFLSHFSPLKWEMLGLPIDEIEFNARKVANV